MCMAISSLSAGVAASNETSKMDGKETNVPDSKSTPPKASIDTSTPSELNSVEAPEEFDGELNTTDEIPSQEVLKRVENLSVLDEDGKAIPFKDLYNGPNVARRVLVIFIRHFFCGNCQEFIRALTSSVTPDDLLHLPTPTFIAIVGCGSPSLISMHKKETSCPFPVYADPTKKIYDELGMLQTLSLGDKRPEYMRKSLMSANWGGFIQSLKALKSGKTFQGGGYHQVGGEFLFEPVNMATPICSPDVANGDNDAKRLGENGTLGSGGGYEEEKRVTWCHRMRNTRDHAEMPELREVLGLDGDGVPGVNKKRWTRALVQRKGTGLTTRSNASTTRNSLYNPKQSGEQLLA